MKNKPVTANPDPTTQGRAAIVTCLQILARRGRQVREAREQKTPAPVVFIVAEETREAEKIEA